MNTLNNRTNGSSNGNNRAVDLEKDIELTRMRMDQTVDELTEKLDPREHLTGAYDWVKTQVATTDFEKLKDVGSKSVRFARENPATVALGLITVGSLFFPKEYFSEKLSQKEKCKTVPEDTLPEPTYDIPDQQNASDWDGEVGRFDGLGPSEEESRLQQLKEKAVGAKDAVTCKVNHASHDAKSRVEDAATKVQDQAVYFATKTKNRLFRGKEEFPLSMALGAAAVGLLAAMVLPGTRRENELFGETSDELIDLAKAQRNNLVNEAKEKLDENGMTLERAKEKTQDFVDEIAERTEEKIEEISDV